MEAELAQARAENQVTVYTLLHPRDTETFNVQFIILRHVEDCVMQRDQTELMIMRLYLGVIVVGASVGLWVVSHAAIEDLRAVSVLTEIMAPPQVFP